MDSKEKKILLLGATFGTGNMGVGALTAGALAIVTRRFPDAAIYFLDYGTLPAIDKCEIGGRTVSVTLINLRYSWKLLLPNNVLALLVLSLVLRVIGSTLREKVIRTNRWLRAIRDADLAVAVSGGDSFSDLYGLSRFFYVSLPQLLVTILGTKLVLLPQSIGPFRHRVSRLVARFLMRRAAICYSRDLEGVREIRMLLRLEESDAKARFCYDMGFVVVPRSPAVVDLGGLEPGTRGSRLLVGLNVSGLLLMGGYTGSNMFQLQVGYQELVSKVIAFLIQVKEANVLLIPHVFGEHAESDTNAVDVVYNSLKDKYPKNLFCVRGMFDQSEIKYIIGLCDFFIGSRMHACIAALSQSIPCIGIAYSAKFLGVLDSIGIGKLVVDPRKLSIEQTLAAIGNALAERHTTKAYLQKTMPAVKDRVLDLLREV